MATLLIILLIGLALAVTALAAAHALRGSQQRQLTTHAATAAQGAAWRGVEALRLALRAAGPDALAAWTGPPAGDAWEDSCGAAPTALDMEVGGTAAIGVPRARLTRICRTATPGVYRVTAEITGEAGAGNTAQTTATLEVVYEAGAEEPDDATPDGGGGVPPSNAVVTFNDDLNLSGSIAVLKDTDTEYQINVRGDLTTGGNTITGVDTIWSTGSVQISSGSRFGTLRSNGDIRFDGSVSATRAVMARGDICVSGGASARDATVRANGSVVADGGVLLGEVAAIGSSDRGDRTRLCGPVALDADGLPYAVDLQGNAGARRVAAAGSVRIHSGSIAEEDGLRASGHLVDDNCGGSESGLVGGSAGGAAAQCTGNRPAWHGVRVQPGLQVAISPVSPVTLEAASFNAYDVEAAAHYAFNIDRNGYRVVTVREVAGIADGTYFIGDYDNTAETGWNRGYRDFMCRELAAGSSPSAPRCRPPVLDPPGTFCVGHSTYNNCIAYDASTRTWTLNGIGFAPGIAWFEGSLHIANGTYFNTFVATRTVSTGGSVSVYALAYAGYDGTRTADGATGRYAPNGICTHPAFPGRHPADYCDTAARALRDPGNAGLGHYALLAGSYDAAGRYVGGDVVLGASNRIFGSLLAGNRYSSGGDSTIHGSISALSLSVAAHRMSGSTTIDLRNLPTGYRPIVPPCAATGTCPEPPAAEPDAFEAAVLWTRYL
ncbi:hypothetical protein [Coralloluteibacterium thermophilus]